MVARGDAGETRKLLVVQARTQSIYRVQSTTEPLLVGGGDAVWNAMLARIQALRPPPSLDQVVVRNFQLQPGVRAVWYYRNPDAPRLLNLEALKTLPDHTLVLVRGCETGKEPTVEKLVGNVLNAYAPVTAQGFCLGFGCVTSEPGNNEDARVLFNERGFPDLQLTFETHTVSTPAASQLPEDAKQMEAAVAAKGGRFECCATNRAPPLA